MIRVLVGCAANNEDLESQAVLEWSIRKNTAREVDIGWAQLSRDSASPWYSDGAGHGWQTHLWTTPFSGFRWALPALTGWQGRAIYMDSDIICLGDIGELWDQPLADGKIVIAKGGAHGQRFCVSLWDCERSHVHLPPVGKLQSDPTIHRTLMRDFAMAPGLVQQFAGGDWNRLDLESFDLNDPRVKALHYTGIPTQLQLPQAIPRLRAEGGRHWYDGPTRPHPRPELQALFDRLLVEATEHGYGIERYRREPFGQYAIRGG